MTEEEKVIYAQHYFDLGDEVEIANSGVIGEITGLRIEEGGEDRQPVHGERPVLSDGRRSGWVRPHIQPASTPLAWQPVCRRYTWWADGPGVEAVDSGPLHTLRPMANPTSHPVESNLSWGCGGKHRHDNNYGQRCCRMDDRIYG